MRKHNNNKKVILKTVIITLASIIIFFFLASIIYSIGYSSEEPLKLSCDEVCSSIPGATTYFFNNETEVCSCYDLNNDLIEVGRLY